MYFAIGVHRHRRVSFTAAVLIFRWYLKKKKINFLFLGYCTRSDDPQCYYCLRVLYRIQRVELSVTDASVSGPMRSRQRNKPIRRFPLLSFLERLRKPRDLNGHDGRTRRV